MDKEQKKAFVEYMQERLTKAETAILADYRGLNVEMMTQLRAQMREAGVEFRVIKNTLTKLAVKDTQMAALADFLVGPTAIAMHETDPVAPAKILVDFKKANKMPEIKGGVLDGRKLDIAEVEALAKMPSKEQMLGKLAGGLAAGPSKLASLMASPAREMVGLLNALKEQREQQTGAA